MVQQVVVGDFRKVRELEIVDVHRVSLFDLLFDELIDHGIGFSRTGSSQDDRCPKRVYDIDPSRIPFLLVIEPCWQIYRVIVAQQTGLLHEGFVFIVEDIIHEMVFHQARDPYAAHEQ